MLQLKTNRIWSILFLIAAITFLIAVGTAEHSYAENSSAEINTQDKEFYANGNEIWIYSVEEEQYPVDESNMSLVKNQKDESADLVVYVYKNEQLSEDTWGEYLSEIYYLSSDYTIYGGGRTGTCAPDGADAIYMYSGVVDTLVMGGKEGDVPYNSLHRMRLYLRGGTIGTIKLVENGYLFGAAITIEHGGFTVPVVNEIILGSEEGECGTFTRCHIEDMTDQSTAKITPGFYNEKPLADAFDAPRVAGADVDKGLWAVNIYGQSFTGIDNSPAFFACNFNDKKLVKVYANGGIFSDGNTMAYDTIIMKSIDDVWGGDATTLSNIPTREKHTFLGWSISSKSGDVLKSEWEDLYIRNKYYAVWRPNYKKANNQTVEVDGLRIQYDTKTDGAAVISQIEKNNNKKIVIPSTVVIDELEYTVTVIDAKALKDSKSITAIMLPKTIEKINKNAFYGAKKLKTINLKIQKSIIVKNGAFKGMGTKNMVIKVHKYMSDKELKKFKKALKKAGYEGSVKRG